ncbi:hypothetical protein SNE40_003006 [Patella caerulea]|uniref:Uncharacterized protein n=1 Tax=Patella caerulea TaxID=87958 RepID=A0AAN8KH41_PATCE
MFFQFKVTPIDRDYLRFLWWKDDKITDYRMSAHLFGAASSPGCANYGLKRAANDFEEEFGSCVADFVRNNFYVDDGLLSVDTEREAIEIVDKSKKLLAKCGLCLHKFVSNSCKVLQEIPIQDRTSTVQSLELFSDELPVERCLGVQWCVQSDTFQFRISLKDRPLTRRGILSTVSSTYDPLGLISPVILVGKQILQELCRNQTDWDSEIPEELRTRWETWRSNLIDLEKLKFGRCFKTKDFGQVQTAELHHFSDASTYGYGQCSYLRPVDENNNVSCSLVHEQVLVASLKLITIPRLELSAALVSVKVSNQLRAELDYENVIESYCTDSKVVLGYINNDACCFHIFVANGISQIRDSTQPNQWHYVKSSENPADIASHGVTAHELLNSKWFSGPDIIWKPTVQASEEQIGNTVYEDDPEVKHVTSFPTHTQKTFELSRLNHISDLFHAKRSIALCLKLKAYLRRRLQTKDLKEPIYGPLSVEDLRKAEDEIIRLVQAEACEDEIKIIQESSQSEDGSVTKCLKRSSRLVKLDPFMYSNGKLCVGGRLKISGYDVMDKHPMILPKKNHVTDCIVRYYHALAEH